MQHVKEMVVWSRCIEGGDGMGRRYWQASPPPFCSGVQVF